jgi:hypothetical protein
VCLNLALEVRNRSDVSQTNVSRSYPNLWCDLFEFSSTLVTHISNVSWVLTLHTVLEVTPNKIVRWSRFGWNGRPSNGSLRTTPIFNTISWYFSTKEPDEDHTILLPFHPCHTLKWRKPLDMLRFLLRSRRHFEMYPKVAPLCYCSAVTHLSAKPHSFTCPKIIRTAVCGAVEQQRFTFMSIETYN